MVRDCASWRMKTRRAALALAVVALMFAYFGGSAAENVSDRQQVPGTRALNQPAAAVASEEPAAGEANRSAAQ